MGSSNLSNAALTSGLEWNTKITKKDLPETIDKVAATFEFYWNDKEFEYYDEGQRERLARALQAEKYFDSNNDEIFNMEIRPYSYQQEILDKLEAERAVRGYTRNLVVAATGTGKTVISALDYKAFQKKNSGKPCRLLFVAHREEILRQSLYTFRAVLRNANFGDMFVGGYRPDSIDHLFMSIQTFNSQDFTAKTSPDFYDYIIVDEFHHAAAPTYQKLLEYYQPKILLGLTATPERMDGKSILGYFNNRIAAEIRLPEAIDRKLLCPFQYFGVTDTVDLDKLLAQKTQKDLLAEKRQTEAELQKALARNDTVLKLYEKVYEDNAEGKVSDEWFMQLSHKYEVEKLELKSRIASLRTKLTDMDNQEMGRENYMAAIRKFMEMDTLTAPLLRELIDHITVYETEGTGKNRTQRVVIHYNFVGYMELPDNTFKRNFKADTRQGVRIEYLRDPTPA